RAVYDVDAGRIEMHLVSLCDQIVQVPDGASRPVAIPFRRGEKIVTEHSYKYTIEGFCALAGAAGLRVEQVWSDPHELFSVYLLRA
ncbi:MAG: L-histidine N(alpha)-methyltransferase, partial [Longimicrobiales bacterium]